MTVLNIYDKAGNKRCSVCKIFKPLERFGKDKRSNDEHKGTCKDCCALQARKSKQRIWMQRAEEEIPMIAIKRYMKKNPIVMKDFIRKHEFNLIPYIEEVKADIIKDYVTRSNATYGRFHPATRENRVSGRN